MNINRNFLGVQQRKISSKPSYKAYAAWYNREDWKKLRNVYIHEHPLCECCLKHDRITPADHVHHMVPFSRGFDNKHKELLLLNEENLMSVCKICHSALHKTDNNKNILNILNDNEYSKAHNLEFMS